MNLPIYSYDLASTKEQFIEFWARQVTSNDIGQVKTLYLPNIGKPLNRESLEALFLWKNQMPFSAAKRGLLETYIARCDEINKLSPKTAASDFLEMFNGRAIEPDLVLCDFVPQVV